MAQLIEVQGMMPPKWWVEWEERPKWYDDAGKLLGKPSGISISSWDERFEEFVQSPRREEGWETMSDDERDALIKLLGWMLAWKPSDRPDVKQVLEAEWMTRWAMPAYQEGLELQQSSSSSSSSK